MTRLSKSKLIQLIHIAKTQLQLDEDTYRAMLNGCVGKTSCKAMDWAELNKVYEHLKSKGFKAKSKAKSTKRLSPKSTARTLGEVAKMRAIWITMAKQGFVKDESETALDAYVNRMLNRRKVGENVSFHTQFLTWQQATQVLEALKQWHKREMIQFLKDNDISPVQEAIHPTTKEVVVIRVEMPNQSKGYDFVSYLFELSINEANKMPNVQKSH